MTALSLTIVNPVELLCRLFKCTQISNAEKLTTRQAVRLIGYAKTPRFLFNGTRRFPVENAANLPSKLAYM